MKDPNKSRGSKAGLLPKNSFARYKNESENWAYSAFCCFLLPFPPSPPSCALGAIFTPNPLLAPRFLSLRSPQPACFPSQQPKTLKPAVLLGREGAEAALPLPFTAQCETTPFPFVPLFGGAEICVAVSENERNRVGVYLAKPLGNVI